MILESEWKFILKKQNCEINNIINDICNSYEAVIKLSWKEIKIIFNYNENINAYLDISKFKQVISNILSNSMISS
jgi:signal transduction histidine kinase